jgi:Ala-tRNA(Pro) deacylase
MKPLIRKANYFKAKIDDGVVDKIKNLLDENKIKYQIFEHEPVYTSEDAARIRGEDPKIGAKSLLFVADSKPILLVLPGDRRVDTAVFKKRFSIKDFRLATSQEVLQYTTVPIGAVHPFGSIANLKTFCDKSLLKNEEIAFNAGAHTVTIKMKAKDYQNIAKPTVTSFT